MISAPTTRKPTSVTTEMYVSEEDPSAVTVHSSRSACSSHKNNNNSTSVTRRNVGTDSLNEINQRQEDLERRFATFLLEEESRNKIEETKDRQGDRIEQGDTTVQTDVSSPASLSLTSQLPLSTFDSRQYPDCTIQKDVYGHQNTFSSESLTASVTVSAEEPTSVLPTSSTSSPTIPAVSQGITPSMATKSALLARILAAQERARQIPKKQPALKERETNETHRKETLLSSSQVTNPTLSVSSSLSQPPSYETAETQEQQQNQHHSKYDGHDYDEEMVHSQKQVMTSSPSTALSLFSMERMEPQEQLVTLPSYPPPSFQIAMEHATNTTTFEMEDATPIPSAPPLKLVESNHQDSFVENFKNIIPFPAKFIHPLQGEEQSHDVPATFSLEPNNLVINESFFDFDIDGQHLSAEAAKELILEQRKLWEQIQKEECLNAAAIAAARADLFDSRSNVTAASTLTNESPLVNSKNSSSSKSNDVLSFPTGETSEESSSKPSTTVAIGGGKHVSLQGQELTLAAIKNGTAILVQCIHCEEWMQVTDTATLMYCPKCQVVSEVIRQNIVTTKEEALQLTLDRKMAQELQDFENRRSSSNSATITQASSSVKEGRIDNTKKTGHHSKSATSLSSYFPSIFLRPFQEEQSELTQPLTATPYEPTRVSIDEGDTVTALSTNFPSSSMYPGERRQHTESLQSVPTVPAKQSSASSDVESRYLEDVSWWNYVTSFLPSTHSSDNSSSRRNTEINVSRPPSALTASQMALHNVTVVEDFSHLPPSFPTTGQPFFHGVMTGEEETHDNSSSNHEHERLISAAHDYGELRPARVGESQQLFSCVVDSISNTANALGSAITSRYTGVDGSGEIHGVDSTSLLSLSRPANREGGDSDGVSGSYHMIPENE